MVSGKSISLCFVVFNQSDLVQRAVNSVKDIIDEIVIVDQGSDKEHSDKFKLLSQQYNYTTNKGNADFDRMFCYQMATKEYILALDADEFLKLETVESIRNLFQYDFDCVWFLFENLMKYGDTKIINLKSILGDDPHPRLWRRNINFQGQNVPTLQWPIQAHQFPKILSEKQIFADAKFTHERELKQVIKTHLNRSKNIEPQAQQMEKEFLRRVLGEFGLDIKKEIVKEFGELKEYLRN